jgi:DNA processing protein
LSLTPGVGNITARALLLKFGLPEVVFEQNASYELQTIVSSAIVQQLRLIPLGLEDALETTWEWLQTQADLGTGKVAYKRHSHLGR